MFRAVLLSVCLVVTLACSNEKLSSEKSKEAMRADFNSIIEKQDQQLKTVVAMALIPVVVAFTFIVFVFYRARRESVFKQQQAEFKLNMAELEMKALRAQINPHFIFNCLNSIHHYMHQHDSKLASEYLIKFSQLIRYVLETSSSRMVALADDLEALKFYLELEQLRMQKSFDFTITSNSDIQPDAIHVPPMMMQPFVENSIWHGLNHRGAGGLIEINISLENDMVCCCIEDNGVRNLSTNEKLVTSAIKKTSMGMSLIKERLAVVSQLYKAKADFVMQDRQLDAVPEAGTRILLSLPYED